MSVETGRSLLTVEKVGHIRRSDRMSESSIREGSKGCVEIQYLSFIPSLSRNDGDL